MAKLQILIIHCTATPEGRKVTSDMIRKWHLKDRGWNQVGYADMIHLDGKVENLVPYNEDNIVDAWELTNGAVGMNSKSRHIVYVGGLEADGKLAKDTRTPEQLKTLEAVVKNTIAKHPDIKVAGHNQFAQKACPSFDVPAWLKAIGVESENIYTVKPAPKAAAKPEKQ